MMSTGHDLTPIRTDECRCPACSGAAMHRATVEAGYAPLPEYVATARNWSFHPMQQINEPKQVVEGWLAGQSYCTTSGPNWCASRVPGERCSDCPMLPKVEAPPLVPAAPARRFPLRMMVVGHGRHGKDAVGEILRDRYSAPFVSSSWFMADRVAYPALAAKYGYASVQECYDDRANHRAEWFDLIAAFNGSDMTTLGRAIFADYDLYVGNRNAREFHAMRNAGVFDVALWVDACERLEYREPRSSLTIEPWMADYIVDNNGSLANLHRNVASLVDRLLAAQRDQSWAEAGTH